jgi:hypothetical protein
VAALIDELLDRARDHLLAGDLAALDGLDARIAAAADSLPPLDAAQALRLRQKAERNERLLQAAGRGLRSALDRKADIARGPRLSTYDASGRKAALPGPATALGRF